MMTMMQASDTVQCAVVAFVLGYLVAGACMVGVQLWRG